MPRLCHLSAICAALHHALWNSLLQEAIETKTVAGFDKGLSDIMTVVITLVAPQAASDQTSCFRVSDESQEVPLPSTPPGTSRGKSARRARVSPVHWCMPRSKIKSAPRSLSTLQLALEKGTEGTRRCQAVEGETT